MSLNDTKCRNAKPKDNDYSLADERGLALLVTAKGGKWWRFNYRMKGIRRTISMGVYPDITLKMARDKREEARKMITAGIDPSANRKAEKLAETGEVKNSFKVITLEWLIDHKTEWETSYYSKVEARLEKDVLPWIGNMPITEVKTSDIFETLKRIQARGAIETAHRVKSAISQIFCYAMGSGRATDNPTVHLEKALKTAKVKHMAAITEPRQVGELLRQLDGYSGTFTVRCALQLAPLLFVRPGELRQAEWKDINLGTAEWRFKASKTHQDHLVPLSKQALEIFSIMHPYSGHGRYVFPSLRSDTRPMSNNAVLTAFRRMAISKDEMTGHGFRAMARTLLAERLRYPDAIIEHQLAHQVRDVHGTAYNRTSFLDDRKIMMQDWADYLDNLKNGKDIVPPRQSDFHRMRLEY